MKKLSVIIASLVLFAGVSFAQQTATMPAKGKAASNKGTTGTAAKGTSTTPVKKVPVTKANAVHPKPVKAVNK